MGNQSSATEKPPQISHNHNDIFTQIGKNNLIEQNSAITQEINKVSLYLLK